MSKTRTGSGAQKASNPPALVNAMESAIEPSMRTLEDRGLGGAVEFHRRIAPRAYAEGRATLLRAGHRQHHAAHACADARENVEPAVAAQVPPRTHGRAPESVGICLSAFGRAAWVRSSPCAGGGVCARRRW